MKRNLIATAIAAIFMRSLAGCGNTTGGRALSGGAIIGGATGMRAGTGAWIGAGLGTGTGTVTAH